MVEAPGGQARRVAVRSARALRRDPAFALLLAQVCVAGTALVVNVVAARALAPTGRGELALLLQVAYLASLLLLLGTDRSLVAVFTGSGAGTGTRALLDLLLRPAGLGLVVAVVLAFAPLPWPAEWSHWLAVAALFAVVNAYVKGSRAVAIAARRQADHVRCTLQSQALLLAGVALLAVLGVRDAGLWLAVYVLSAAVPTTVQVMRWRREGGEPPAATDVTSARREGLQLVPAALATSGMLRIDRLLLPALASTAALGLYAGVATMTELLSWPLGALADARLGRWREAADAGRLAVRRILVACAVYALLGAAAVAWLVTTLALPLLGPSYVAAGALVAPLVAAAGVLGVEQVAVTLLVARRRNRAASAVETVGFVVSLVAYVALIPAMGALGAAYGSLLGYGAGLLVACVLLRDRARPCGGGGREGAGEGPLPVLLQGPRRPGVGWVPLVPLLLVAIGGRYTLERSGIAWLAWLDLRVLGLCVAVPLVAAAVRGAAGPGAGRLSEGWLVAAVLFFAVQIGSGLWAPPGARVAETAVDVAATAGLVLALYVLARRDPEAVVRRTLVFLLVTGLVFAAGAFAGGGGVQGRFAAFGGGPNVFVRIELLGVLAAVTLVLTGASRALLLTLPPMLVGAVASGSRGGLLAALVVVAVLAVRAGHRARVLAAAGLAGAASVLLLAAWLYAPVGELLRSRFVEQTVEEQYSSGRTSIWEDSLALVVQHPLAGAGLDGFHGTVGLVSGVEHPHNYLLAVAAETGLLGLSLLAVTVALWARTVRRTGATGDVLTRAMLAATLFVAVAAMFSGGYYDARLAWCFAALAAAVAGRRAVPPALPAPLSDLPVPVPAGRR